MGLNKTTTHNTMNYVVDAFGRKVDVLHLDFSKAFGRVCQQCLPDKRLAYGVNGSLLQWFASYFGNRRLRVEFSSALSDHFFRTSGVPQGSILEQLFCVFINDVVHCIKANRLLFADDIKIFNSVLLVRDCELHQHDLPADYRWSCDHRMSLNLKTSFSFCLYRLTSLLLYIYSNDGATLEGP